jgi:hypothetical protein
MHSVYISSFPYNYIYGKFSDRLQNMKDALHIIVNFCEVEPLIKK